MENKVPEEWIKQVEKQESSGKSITAWCKENGIAYSTYQYRRQKVKEEYAEQKEVKKETKEQNKKEVKTAQEIVKIDFCKAEDTGKIIESEVETKVIRMIKGDVQFEFPVTLASEIIRAVIIGGGGRC